ncbi:MAG TPA: hypothetical protein VLJ17_00655, partial [Xanthobacteraceae bacterium]|nr:hypothetical protein [Xanthobacteraceae bacterium]
RHPLPAFAGALRTQEQRVTLNDFSWIELHAVAMTGRVQLLNPHQGALRFDRGRRTRYCGC